MPKNKNASFRYRVIDQCLRNTGRKWTLQDLIDKISDELYEQFGNEEGVSKRTVQSDINIMRSDPPRGFAAPIKVKEGSYFYSDPDFSINQNPLNETDIENLKEAVDILRHFRGLPIYNEIEKMIGKLQQDIFTSQNNPLIEVEQVEELRNVELIGALYPFLRKQKVLKVNYKPFQKDQSVSIDIHPYLLKEYNNRWFLLGWNNDFKNYTVLAIDRIINYREISKEFINSEKKNMLHLLKNIIGVSIPKEKEIQKIEIEVIKTSVPYFKTKPMHSSQRLKVENDGSAVFSLSLIPNYELEQLLLSFGENLVVRKPDNFKEHMRKRISELKSKYPSP